MDVVDVIVLDDSSDASSDGEVARASASTTPAASPSISSRFSTSGPGNAVEQALALAAAYQTAAPAPKKKKKATPAPPLAPTKPKRPLDTQSSDRRPDDRRPELNRVEERRNITSRPKDKSSRGPSLPAQDFGAARRSGEPTKNYFGSSAPSRSHSDRQPIVKHKKKRDLERYRGRPNGNSIFANERRRSIPKPNKQKRAEIVDLMSSSSSSAGSSSSGRSRSSSMSPSSSLSSSDSDIPMTPPSSSAKKRLVLNDRVHEKAATQPRFMGRIARPSSRPSRDGDSNSDEEMSSAPLLKRKRKRVATKPRQDARNGGEKRDTGVRIQLTKKKKVKPTMKTAQVKRGGLNPKVLEDICASSSSSSSGDSSLRTPPTTPTRKVPASTVRGVNKNRKQAATTTPRKLDKSITVNTSSSRKSAPATPPSSSPLSSPESHSLLRKKRRVYSYFDMDRVSLDDLQAQERELAYIQAQHKAQGRTQAPKPAAKRKVCREVICVDDHSDSNVSSVPMECDHGKPSRKTATATNKRSPPVILSSAAFHSTSFRGVYLKKAPANILPANDQSPKASVDTGCDHPLSFYDDTDSLEQKCTILKNFGKTVPCVSSVFLSEMAKPQSDVTSAVSSMISEHLSLIRRCHQRKKQSILDEARRNVRGCQCALEKQRKTWLGQTVLSLGNVTHSTKEKHTIKQVKLVTQSSARASFQIARANQSGFLHEKTVSFPTYRLEKILTLRPYTTSIGLRSSYRVDDDPILRYTATTRPSGAGSEDAAKEAEKKYGLRIGSVADEEVVEYVLRLVVADLGDSEQVFHALKSELDFSQAYTAYSELKKLHDSRERTRLKLTKAQELVQDGRDAKDPEIAALAKLMKQSSLSASPVQRKSLRLQPPIRSFESNIADNLVDGATAGIAALGLRVSDSYNDLADVYCDSFCRMCYQYGCHEHGGDHPLPARRVDPIYPRIQSVPPAALDSAADEDASDDDVVCLEMETMPSMTDIAQPSQVLRDPSEFIDAHHVSMVTMKMRVYLSDDKVCGAACWKVATAGACQHAQPLSRAELAMARKLRETMGDNSCLLAAVIGSATCIQLHEFIKRDENGHVEDVGGRSSRRMRNWKQGRRSGGSNHELVQRTRNHRLQDRGTENHEYKPCMHEGMCDSTGCSCMKRDHMCEKACACSRDCPNRFEGCQCGPGRCRTSECPCFAALRECDPDVCTTCGASAAAVAVLNNSTAVHEHLACGNTNVSRGMHKRLSMSFSDIHGWGMFAMANIATNEFVYEYTGAMLSQDEAERRGFIYDKMEMSYLFDLNEDAVLDALRSGNKSKFINHDGVAPNCTAKIVSVCGIHHISVWALRDIAEGEELVFDYGYKGNVGPEWSHRRSASRGTS